MPLGFWGDDDGSRYRAAYFERFPGVWAHGDFAAWTDHGGMVIYGRSDATLNAVRRAHRHGRDLPRRSSSCPRSPRPSPSGRSGTATPASCCSCGWPKAPSLDDALADTIRRTLRERCSPRHVPARIAAVADIPRTRSGKITELAVADVVNGREVRNTEALANPEALEQFRDRPELAT